MQNQKERRRYLIEALLKENKQSIDIPSTDEEQKYLLRALMNVRLAKDISEDFIKVQDEYLKEELKEKGITDIKDLTPAQNDLYLWRGDITTLKVGAIVNAANSGMTGCYQPCHACIDNCIHTFAGVQLRSVCDAIMQKQGHPEPTGKAKITPAFNLPCDYVLHTVGPIINGPLATRDCELLSSCYTSCLDLAKENNVESIAFCCISTGVFCFPQEKAAQIAIGTVKKWKEKNNSRIKVVFNVFGQKDENIYRELLQI